CGFAAEPAPLDRAAQTALGLPAAVRNARVAEGRGVLRALCLELPAGALLRDSIAALTARVQRKSPFALWLVFAGERGGPLLSISCALTAPRARVSQLLVDRTRVVDSDAETLRAVSAASDGLDVLVHARWCELLGREALTQRFFRALEHAVGALAVS